MFAVFTSGRKLLRRSIMQGLAILGVLALAACDPAAIGGLSGGGGGQQINPDRPVQVALLVPRGSGNPGDEVLAQSLVNAARLAAAGLKGAQIDLRVYSTAGNAEQAVTQAQQAITDGAKIILGPVYAESANAVGIAAAARNVNVLSFSNTTGIAGGNVFVLGPTFDNTAQRLLGYARSRGRGRVVVVHGNDVAGQSGRNAIQSAAARAGAQVVATVGYELTQQGVTSAVPRITAAVRGGGADSVFLTSTSAGALPLYAALLPEAGLRLPATQMIGLTRWDIPPQTLSLPGLQGGWFALPDPARTSEFASRYAAAYGSQPHPIGGLAFDGIAAIGALVAQGGRDALSQRSLTQSSGFQGATGVFRLLPDGTNQRALAVASVDNGRLTIVDPAPQSFGGF